jgi:hypothetical protein
MGPRVTSARSTLTGFGLSANARPPAAAAASDAIKMSLATRDAIALQPFQSRAFSTATRSNLSTRRRTMKEESAAAMITIKLALAKVARSITKGTR